MTNRESSPPGSDGGAPRPLREGRATALRGRDSQESRQDERQALAFYQAFRNSNDAKLYTDQKGTILEVNDAFVRLFGYSREESVGKTPRIVRSPKTPPAFYESLWQDILDPAKGFWRGQVLNRTKDGRDVSILLSITAVRDGGDIVGFVSNSVDLTEHEEMQKRLATSESLAAVGSMAAIVAHEIRNPLNSIVTAANSISRQDLPPDERETLLGIIRAESNRLNNRLSQFLQFARPRELHCDWLDLNAAVREVLKIVRADTKLRGKVKIQERLDKGLGPTRFDGDQIRQVLWNIMLNAMQAMAGKGRLTVSTEKRDGGVLLHISDTGPGIAANQLDKLFTPFYTTKPQGTGLGLAVADRIVSRHHGRILVERAPGGGTRFTLSLPLDPEAA
ncbi:MAG: hypothetical protein A2X36_10630 [Elusimicrobia bacterium GWA2_69_24]|nr:MAG: hypothetical protein A2X36_10630 [Elusimicrobia bacterium GWA2_69_24]